jgi:hypothetical protein
LYILYIFFFPSFFREQMDVISWTLFPLYFGSYTFLCVLSPAFSIQVHIATFSVCDLHSSSGERQGNFQIGTCITL